MNSSDSALVPNGDQIEYNPSRLLDTIIENLRLKNDAQLCRLLEVAPPS